MTRSYDYEALAAGLFDVLASRPEGVTSSVIQTELDIPKHATDRTIKRLRSILGVDDQINLVCEPQGQHQEWVYELKGSYTAGSWWIANRLKDSETRIETMSSVVASLGRGLDKRTTEGKKAKVMAKGLTRIMEDLRDIRAEDDGYTST